MAGNVAYAFDGGDLIEVSLTTGRTLASIHVGDVTRFATPAPVGPFVLVGTTSQVMAISGRS